MLSILTTAFKTGWLRLYCQLNAWLCTHSTAAFPLWLLKKHLGLPTSWQMEEQPHTHSLLQATLCGSKHNNNPQAGQSSYAALLSMNLQCWIQGFPWSTANETSVQDCTTLCEFTENGNFRELHARWALTKHRGVMIWHLWWVSRQINSTSIVQFL